MMINLQKDSINVNLKPDDFERYFKSYGETADINEDLGIIETRFLGELGGVFNFFLMSWQWATEEEVSKLKELLVSAPYVEEPMTLTWRDGGEYKVIFAPIGDSKCLFDKSVIDPETGTALYTGQVALIEITREEQ